MVVKSAGRDLYVYTTPHYRRKNYLKVGESPRGGALRRIQRQFGTSNPERPIHLWTAELPAGKTDKHVHHMLEARGVERIRDGAGREWFVATLEQVKRAYNEVCYGSARPDSFSLTGGQNAAVIKATRWFEGKYPKRLYKSVSHPDRFLLNAKMRFGKSITSLHIVKALNVKKCLVITYKPEVISGWMEDLRNHVAFNNWIAIRARRLASDINQPHLPANGKLPKAKGTLVACVSLQDLTVDGRGHTKRRLQHILKEKWDLIIFDEVHFGSGTDRAKEIVERRLSWNKRLDLSGTPFKLIQQDDFCPEQVFTYSYLDEQRDKRAEQLADPHDRKRKVLRAMPDLDISTIAITREDLNEDERAFYSDDLDFSLNELFRVRSGNFVHEDAVDHFIEGLCNRSLSARSISVYGKLAQRLGLPAKRHSVWWLSRVNSVRALARKLRAHPYFSEFEIIDAAGVGDQETENDDAIIAREAAIVRRKIEKFRKGGKRCGTITLTVGRFLTGVTIPQWESILVLNDVSSPEAYFQALFRVQSQWLDPETGGVLKNKAWVFDFAVSRCLRHVFDYADALAAARDLEVRRGPMRKDSIEPWIDDLCAELQIKQFYEGSLRSDEARAQDVFQALSLSGSRLSLARRITSDALVKFGALTLLEDHPKLLQALKRVKGYRNEGIGTLQTFIQIGIEAQRLERGVSGSSDDEVAARTEKFANSGKTKKKRDSKKWFARQVKRLAICMADFIYMTQFREFRIDDVIETRDPEFFHQVTGITKEEFRKLCDLGFINREQLNLIVRQFRIHEETSLQPEVFIRDCLKKAA